MPQHQQLTGVILVAPIGGHRRTSDPATRAGGVLIKRSGYWGEGSEL